MIKMLTSWVSGENSLLGFYGFAPCMLAEGELWCLFLLLQQSHSPSATFSGRTDVPMTSFNLHYLYTGPISKHSHTGGWDFNIRIWGGDTIQSRAEAV